MRVLEPGGEADLALEPLRPQRGRQLGVKDLEGDRPVVADVLGQVDRRHAPAAELPLDRVAAGEGSSQPGSGFGHYGWAVLRRVMSPSLHSG